MKKKEEKKNAQIHHRRGLNYGKTIKKTSPGVEGAMGKKKNPFK